MFDVIGIALVIATLLFVVAAHFDDSKNEEDCTEDTSDGLPRRTHS